MKKKPVQAKDNLRKPSDSSDKVQLFNKLNEKLNDAVKKGDSEKVKEFLNAGAQVNNIRTTPLGYTPLAWACYYKNTQIAEILIKAGADINKKILYDDTALRIACNAYESAPIDDLVRLLLENGAKPNQFKRGTDGPIHYAAMYNQPEAVKLLIKHGADVNLKGAYGRTALIYAASSAANPEMVKSLIEAGANVSAKNQSGENALFELITQEKSNTEVAKILIDNGISVNCSNKHYGTVLHWAAFCGRTNIAELLIKQGADIESEDKFGDTPILKAMSRNNKETVKLLFNKGANPESKSRFGFSLMEYVAESGDQEFLNDIVAKIKTNQKNSLGSLHEAAKKGDLQMVKMLIEAGFEIDEKDSWGSETAFMKAAYHGKLEVVGYLFQQGADIKARDYRGNTALLNAAWSGHLDVVKALIHFGAEINEKNKLNWNALMQACVEGHYEIAKFFLENGSPLDEIDLEKGATALTLAKYSKSTKLVELLESFGAKERPIKMRKQSEPYFSIFDCGICLFLPNKKDLGNTESMEEFKGLEIIHSHSAQTDRYCDQTELILKCVNCGTYYHQFHSIDTEDAFVGGPSISHNFMRYNLVRLKETLRGIDKTEEYNELEQRYDAIIEEFKNVLKEKSETINKNFLPYVIESITDFYINQKNWNAIKENLLNHSKKEIALEVAHDLIIMHGVNSWGGIYPFYTSYKSISKSFQDNFRPFFMENIADFIDYLNKFETDENQVLISKFKIVMDSAKYYQVL